MWIRKIIGTCLVFLFLLFLYGCTPAQQQMGAVQFEAMPGFEPGNNLNQSSESIARRFEEAAPQNRSAVESAIELLEKHAKLSEQVTELEKRKQILVTENEQFKQQTTRLESQLQQAQKELAEANDLLIKMRVELNSWKTDVLGFRGEMRDAEKAQLVALVKILRILSGEATVVSGISSQQGRVGETAAATVLPNETYGSAEVDSGQQNNAQENYAQDESR